MPVRFKRIETTNYGPPKVMPQFKDADELMKRLRTSKKLKGVLDSVEITAVTIRERAADRAIEACKEGYGPDRILFMVSTERILSNPLNRHPGNVCDASCSQRPCLVPEFREVL